MKVLQLIDSLNAGGAERVAVNYSNSLASRIEASFLCTTREEGVLKGSLSKNVQYLFFIFLTAQYFIYNVEYKFFKLFKNEKGFYIFCTINCMWRFIIVY